MLSAITVDRGGRGYIVDSANKKVYSYDSIATRNGTLAPDRTIGGTNTQFSEPAAVVPAGVSGGTRPKGIGRRDRGLSGAVVGRRAAIRHVGLSQADLPAAVLVLQLLAAHSILLFQVLHNLPSLFGPQKNVFATRSSSGQPVPCRLFAASPSCDGTRESINPSMNGNSETTHRRMLHTFLSCNGYVGLIF